MHLYEVPATAHTFSTSYLYTWLNLSRAEVQSRTGGPQQGGADMRTLSLKAVKATWGTPSVAGSLGGHSMALHGGAGLRSEG